MTVERADHALRDPGRPRRAGPRRPRLRLGRRAGRRPRPGRRGPPAAPVAARRRSTWCGPARSSPRSSSPARTRPATCCCWSAASSCSPTGLAWGEGRYLAAVARRRARPQRHQGRPANSTPWPPCSARTRSVRPRRAARTPSPALVDKSDQARGGRLLGPARRPAPESVELIANEVLERICAHAGCTARGHQGTPRAGQAVDPRVAALPLPHPVPAVRGGPPGAGHPAVRLPRVPPGLRPRPARRTGRRARPGRREGARGLLPVRVAGPAVPEGPGGLPAAPYARRSSRRRGVGACKFVRTSACASSPCTPSSSSSESIRLIGGRVRTDDPTVRRGRRRADARVPGHPAAQRHPVPGAAPADAHQGQEGRARRLHLVRPARHQPARRGVRGPDVVHRASSPGEELYEVAKGGDPKDGSWLVPRRRPTSTPTRSSYGAGTRRPARRSGSGIGPGSFVYRLSGRDRQTSASYYTPESLTKVTVAAGPPAPAGPGRVDDRGTGAAGLEDLRTGAGLGRVPQRGHQPGRRGVPAPPAGGARRADRHGEVRRSNSRRSRRTSPCTTRYGVDLNSTAVELAEVSLWLNTMHPGMEAPWFGLHLRRGNSLIGGRREIYSAERLKKGGWLGATPERFPLTEAARRAGAPAGAVHHFLLPAKEWGAVAGEKEAKALAPEDAKTAGGMAQGHHEVAEREAGGTATGAGPAGRVPVGAGVPAPGDLRAGHLAPDRCVGRGGRLAAVSRRRRCSARRSSPTWKPWTRRTGG